MSATFLTSVRSIMVTAKKCVKVAGDNSRCSRRFTTATKSGAGGEYYPLSNLPRPLYLESCDLQNDFVQSRADLPKCKWELF